MSGQRDQNAADLDRLLRMFADRPEEPAIEPLGGGFETRCYRVRGAGFDYAVRLPGSAPSDFRLDPRTEARLLETLARAGITPPVIELGTDAGAIVTEFLAGASPWTRADARTKRNVRRLAARLRALHATEAELEPLRVVEAAEAYAGTAASRVGLDERQRRWREELLRSAAEFSARFSAATVCHNDLVASNVLDDGRLWLVDFEYAVLSEPILDLAGAAAMNGFESRERTGLVTAYYAGQTVPFGPDEFGHAIRLLRLLAYFWALAHGSRAREAKPFDAFAGELAAVLR